ncbi:MAG: hypothetical protein WDN10_02940 [bacterium]
MELYEIPEELKGLYKHWENHAKRPEPAVSHDSISRALLDPVIAFAGERMRIWDKKSRGLAAPYTDDPELSNHSCWYLSVPEKAVFL